MNRQERQREGHSTEDAEDTEITEKSLVFPFSVSSVFFVISVLYLSSQRLGDLRL